MTWPDSGGCGQEVFSLYTLCGCGVERIRNVCHNFTLNLTHYARTAFKVPQMSMQELVSGARLTIVELTVVEPSEPNSARRCRTRGTLHLC